MDGCVVLVTGGAGFLGQHIVRELQLRKSDCVKEIRILDLNKYHQRLCHASPIPVVSYVGDITDVSTLRNAFRGVSCVMHCAAHVSYQYPPDYEKLYDVNVTGTQNVIAMCRQHNIPKLIFTGTAEVSFVPYIGPLCFTVIINQAEKKALPPTDSSMYQIPGYAESKCEAEKLVLAANGTYTKNGSKLKTVSLRPPLVYGEEDNGFMSSIVGVAQKFGGRIPKIAGAGGKQQVVYAGNVAWAHLCAMDTLDSETTTISGVAAFITDDTPVEDATRTCERLTRSLCTANRWYVPMVVSFALAVVAQSFAALMSIRMPASPVSLVSYMCSFILFNRLRASLHLGYAPVYDEQRSTELAAEFYVRLYRMMCKSDHKREQTV